MIERSADTTVDARNPRECRIGFGVLVVPSLHCSGMTDFFVGDFLPSKSLNFLGPSEHPQ